MPERAAIRTTIPGPWGPFHLAATERGVVAVAWLTTEAGVRRGPRRNASASRSRTRATCGPAIRARIHLDAGAGRARGRCWRAGRPDAPSPSTLPTVRRGTRRVLEAVATIPWGTTASYGEIARQVGAPRAARAVGGAVGRNPVSLLIPCHRVIASDGTIGGYGGDGWGSRDERLAMKRDLLRREGVTLAASNR